MRGFVCIRPLSGLPLSKLAVFYSTDTVATLAERNHNFTSDKQRPTDCHEARITYDHIHVLVVPRAEWHKCVIHDAIAQRIAEPIVWSGARRIGVTLICEFRVTSPERPAPVKEAKEEEAAAVATGTPQKRAPTDPAGDQVDAPPVPEGFKTPSPKARRVEVQSN